MFDIFGAISGVSKAISGISQTIETITAKIADHKIALINADTDRKRIDAEERIKSLEMQRDVLIKGMEARASLQQAEAQAGLGIANVAVRTFIALPIGILLWKVFVWDKALGQWTQGVTDRLDTNLWSVVTAVLAFYFLYEGAVGVTRLIKQPSR